MKNVREALGKLRETGFKLTPQRLAILEVLEGNHSHPSAQSIFQSVKARYPMISFATVYKTLKVLERVGEIQSLSITENKLNFDPDTSRHHHFYCRSCEKIFDIFPSEGQVPQEIDGHRVDRSQVYYYGICSNCTKSE